MSAADTGSGSDLVLDDVLMSGADPVTTEEAEAIAVEFFGVTGQAKALTGERDANFLLTRDSGAPLVLKVSNARESLDEGDLQTQVLLHLESRDMPVPRPLLPIDGSRVPRWIPPGRPPRNLRLVTLLQGRTGSEVPVDRDYCVSLGRLAARIDQALVDFEHPHQGRPLSWDARRLGELCPAELRTGAVARAIGVLEEHVLPGLADLPEQLVHNDLNPHNLIAGSGEGQHEITGVIDFGDVLRAPRVLEIATAGAYHVVDVLDPLAATTAIARGYHSLSPLGPKEARLIPGLLFARVALSLTINGWLAARNPGRADYLLRNSARASAALDSLTTTDLELAGDKLAAALSLSTKGEA